MKWMESTKELLARLAGQWIAIEGNSLVAVSEEFTKVSQEARQRGIVTPFIIYVPEPTRDSIIGI